MKCLAGRSAASAPCGGNRWRCIDSKGFSAVRRHACRALAGGPLATWLARRQAGFLRWRKPDGAPPNGGGPGRWRRLGWGEAWARPYREAWAVSHSCTALAQRPLNRWSGVARLRMPLERHSRMDRRHGSDWPHRPQSTTPTAARTPATPALRPASGGDALIACTRRPRRPPGFARRAARTSGIAEVGCRQHLRMCRWGKATRHPRWHPARGPSKPPVVANSGLVVPSSNSAACCVRPRFPAAGGSMGLAPRE